MLIDILEGFVFWFDIVCLFDGSCWWKIILYWVVRWVGGWW